MVNNPSMWPDFLGVLVALGEKSLMFANLANRCLFIVWLLKPLLDACNVSSSSSNYLVLMSLKFQVILVGIFPLE